MATNRVDIRVIAAVPTDLFMCRGCEELLGLAGAGQKVHKDVSGPYPEDVRRLADDLAQWTSDLNRRWGNRVRVHVVDPQTPQGIYLSLRHGLRRYPAFVVNGRKVACGSDLVALERALQDCGLDGLSGAGAEQGRGHVDGELSTARD